MTLARKQAEFAQAVGRLLAYVATLPGYAVTFGEAYRTREQAALNAAAGRGIADSVHTLRLAVDFNLFIGGVYQTRSEAYKPLGEYWETLHPAARWGGRFGDGNHFSFEHRGRK